MEEFQEFNKFYIEGFSYSNGCAEQNSQTKIEIYKDLFVDFISNSEYKENLKVTHIQNNIALNYLNINEFNVFLLKWFKYQIYISKNESITKFFDMIQKSVKEWQKQGVNETYVFATL